MKNPIKQIVMIIVFIKISLFSFAQNEIIKRIAVLPIRMQNLEIGAESLSNITRMAVNKTNRYVVMNKYDMQSMLEHYNTDINNCLSTKCVLDLGKEIKIPFVLTGEIQKYLNNIAISIRIFDIESEEIIFSQTEEYLYLPNQIKNMIEITINKMLGLEYNKALLEKLIDNSALDNAINNTNKRRLALDGPRMGLALFTGDNAKVLQAAEKDGGYNMLPIMSFFGYQTETQYLNEGNFQALIEYIFLISGIDQGRFIPSFTFLNGFRNNISGWEIGFGPSFRFIKKARGYYDNTGKWNLGYDWNEYDTLGYRIDPPYDIVERLDKRGSIRLSTAFVFTIGKTFKSGNLNIPINLYIVPRRDGTQIGLSFGFNNKK